ncbi:archease [Candidatus Micrarchaeota archaeon]|nr:archease [Candidatus Micrarchaeota archaeon]
MKPYKFFDHTADVLYEAYGQTFPEALENAAKALFETIADLTLVGTSKKVTIRETALSESELAAFVLSDLVAERDAHGLFFRSFAVTRFAETKDGFVLEGVARGAPMSAKAGVLDVKAVTHHETKAERKNGNWVVRVLLDI